MKRTVFASCAVSVSLFVGACGGDDGSSVVPPDRLDAALLTIDDFDSDWSEEMRGVFTSREEGPQSLDPAGWCPRAQSDVDDLARIEELAGDTGAAVEFRHARTGVRRMFHGVSQQVWSNDNVDEYLNVVSRSFDACMGQTWSPEPDQEVTISSFDAPEWGDRSVAVSIDIVTPGPDGDYGWTSRLVVIVIDSSLMIVRDLDVQIVGGEKFMSDAEWIDFVDIAADQFEAVARAGT